MSNKIFVQKNYDPKKLSSEKGRSKSFVKIGLVTAEIWTHVGLKKCHLDRWHMGGFA